MKNINCKFILYTERNLSTYKKHHKFNANETESVSDSLDIYIITTKAGLTELTSSPLALSFTEFIK